MWSPTPPDVLVAARLETLAAVPPEIRRGLPSIAVLTAWGRLKSTTPSMLLPNLWDRGMAVCTREDGGSPAEREAWLISCLLSFLVDRASPDELVALSRPGGNERGLMS